MTTITRTATLRSPCGVRLPLYQDTAAPIFLSLLITPVKNLPFDNPSDCVKDDG